MPSVRFEVQKSKAAKGKAIPIRLRVAQSINGKQVRRFIPTGLKTTYKNWLPAAQAVRSSAKHAAAINANLASIKEKATAIMLDMQLKGKVITVDNLTERIKAEITHSINNVDFIAYSRELIAGYMEQGQIATAVRHRVVINKLEAYRSVVVFDDISVEFIRRFRSHLSSKYGNSNNTINKNLRTIRTFLYQAYKEGRADPSKNPFFGITLKDDKTQRTRLTPAQIEILRDLKLVNARLLLARDCFLFSLYTGGIRFSDVAQMKWDNLQEGRLEFKASKTKTPRSILVIEALKPIIDRYEERRENGGYIFPILDSSDLTDPVEYYRIIRNRNAHINNNLKTIAQKADLPAFSFHVARHSFADLARKEGWGLYTISKALGHSSVKQTERYLAGFDHNDVDEHLSKLF